MQRRPWRGERQGMTVITPEPPLQQAPKAVSLVGYRVFGPEGWVGTVTQAYNELLLVRTGLFHPQWITVHACGIERVDMARRAVTLDRDPREFVASDRRGRNRLVGTR